MVDKLLYSRVWDTFQVGDGIVGDGIQLRRMK